MQIWAVLTFQNHYVPYIKVFFNEVEWMYNRYSNAQGISDQFYRSYAIDLSHTLKQCHKVLTSFDLIKAYAKLWFIGQSCFEFRSQASNLETNVVVWSSASNPHNLPNSKVPSKMCKHCLNTIELTTMEANRNVKVLSKHQIKNLREKSQKATKHPAHPISVLTSH